MTASRTAPVARVDDVPAGWVLRVRWGTRDVALAHLDGQIVAVDDRCPHAGGPLGDSRLVDGCLAWCPWHGSTFDVRTGAVREGPARRPLSSIPAEVDEQGRVFLLG